MHLSAGLVAGYGARGLLLALAVLHGQGCMVVIFPSFNVPRSLHVTCKSRKGVADPLMTPGSGAEVNDPG